MVGSRLLSLRIAALYVAVFILTGVFQLLRNPNYRAKKKSTFAFGLAGLLLLAIVRAIPLWPF
jgi:hypothetical protein